MKKGIIFDVDGTLWDSCQVVADSWNEYLRKAAPDVPVVLTRQDLRSVMGKTMSQIGDALFPMVEKERREQVTDGCCVYEVEMCIRDSCGLVHSSYHLMVTKRLQPQPLCIVVNQLDTA